MSTDGSLPATAESAVAGDFSRLSGVRFGREICGDLAAAERREWWIGNGRGDAAAGSLALSLTRRCHGLLITTIHLARRPRSAPPGPPPRLSAALMANGRDHHGETWMPGFVWVIAAAGDALTMRVPALQIRAKGGRIAEHRGWDREFRSAGPQAWSVVGAHEAWWQLQRARLTGDNKGE
jgi:hypothetical protein